MAIVIAILLSSVTLAMAAAALTGAGYNMWRLRHTGLGRAPSDSTLLGTAAEIVAKAALIIMEIVTILYLAVGITPVDALLLIGVHLPTTMNKYLLLFGTEIQVIIGTLGFIWLNHSVKNCYFPREGEGRELRRKQCTCEHLEDRHHDGVCLVLQCTCTKFEEKKS